MERNEAGVRTERLELIYNSSIPTAGLNANLQKKNARPIRLPKMNWQANRPYELKLADGASELSIAAPTAV
jgi:hypothetical protein